MRIPFTKAHGARNDFLLTWSHEAPREQLTEAALILCDRHSGVGADGWLLVSRAANAEEDASIRLFNSDGSEPEISGNGTRCAAAFLIDSGVAENQVRIRTGAGVKYLRLLSRDAMSFVFEMNMGRAVFAAGGVQTLQLSSGPREVDIVDVGNPQCAVFCGDFDFDWRGMGAEIERHPRFPNRTNVSFIRPVDGHTIDVRFFERGAGETMSSGTGSTGAAAVALRRGLVSSPVTVLTQAGPLDLRVEGEEIFLTGPAQIVAGGEFYL
jgi:diaminopimelate epimerase